MTDLLRAVLNDVEKLDARQQDAIAHLIREQLKADERDARFAEAYATDAFRVGLQRALDQAASGQGTVYLEIVSLDAALDPIPYEAHDGDADANI